MYARIFFIIAFLATVPVWPQVEPSGTGGGITPDEDTRMLIPPPVSAEAYPTTSVSETRSNYLNAGVVFSTAYNDNVLAGASAYPVSDVTYSIWPRMALDQTTPRQHRKLTYNSGFTFYQPTSVLNAVDQNATLDYMYRLSPRATLSVQDAFQQSSSIFNQPYLLLEGTISGSTQPSTVTVIVPYANFLVNTANAEYLYQFSANGMVGGGGTYAVLNYPNPNQVVGLYDSKSSGASGFYSRRFASTQYAGAIYQYSRIVTNPVEVTTHTHTLFAFYTIYLRRTLSLSLAGGPQYFDSILSGVAPTRSWTPAANASISWQGDRTNLAARYSRTVTGGGGLLGTYNSTSADVSAYWAFLRSWGIRSGAGYSISKNATSIQYSSYPGGHSIAGTISMQHAINNHLSVELGYARLHQTYNGIPVISSGPDSNRGYVSITYQFRKPLGQ